MTLLSALMSTESHFSEIILSGNLLTAGGNSFRGLSIHVSARVMGKFEIFCPGYRSCFVNLALFMGLLCKDLP